MKPEDDVRGLREWMYDGSMNADHFSGEMRFQNNGTGVNITFRVAGKPFSVWIAAADLRELLALKEGSSWAERGAEITARAEGYARGGSLRDIEPGCHLRWVDNYAFDVPTGGSAASPKILRGQSS